MKALTLAALLLAGIATAHAQSPTAVASTCKERAAEKKLAGAALNSFMKKCEKDATTACTTDAAEKKLRGAAKNSFVKKCVTDAVGAQ